MTSSPMPTETSPTSGAPSAEALPDYAPVPSSALGPAVNDQGYYVGRVERNLYWVTDGTYQSAFLTTREGVVLLDAPPTIGHNLRRAVDKSATAIGAPNTVTPRTTPIITPPMLARPHCSTRTSCASGTRRRGASWCPTTSRPPAKETFWDHRTLEIGDHSTHGTRRAR